MRCVAGSAASVDSQTPVDPRYAGPLAGRLAPLPDFPPRLLFVELPEFPPWLHVVDRRRVDRRRRQLVLGPELPPCLAAKRRALSVWKGFLEHALCVIA